MPVRQANVAGLGVDQRGRRSAPQAPPVRQIGLRQRVVGGIVAVAPAVEDQQDDRFRAGGAGSFRHDGGTRSEEHTSELQSLMRISYAVFCLKKKSHTNTTNTITQTHYNTPHN